jgi:pimeloyl-ACP methyl ester carboxylesterase
VESLLEEASFESRFASNGGVRLHYLVGGDGPPVIFLHGFPDYSGGWLPQLSALAPRFRVIAPDLRGFNKSDAPDGIVPYSMPMLVKDVLAVMVAEGLNRASIVGHDWGGSIAFWLAMRVPEAVAGLVSLSMTHPRCYLRAAARSGSGRLMQYIRDFQAEGSEGRLDLEELSRYQGEEHARRQLMEALQRSSRTAMMNIYRANAPRGELPDLGYLPKVKAPTLVIFSADDPYLPSGAFDGLHEEVDNVTTLISVPRKGHFVHHRAAAFVSERIADFIAGNGPA